MKTNIERLVELIEKEKQSNKKIKIINYKNVKKMILSYNKIIAKLEKENIQIFVELEEINFDSISKNDSASLYNKYEQLINEKYNLLTIFLKNELFKLNILKRNSLYSENEEYITEKQNEIDELINSIKEDKETHLYTIKEENQNIDELKKELSYLESLLNNNDELEEENLEINTVIEKIEFNKKQVKQSEEAIVLLNLDVLIFDIKLKHLQFEKNLL